MALAASLAGADEASLANTGSTASPKAAMPIVVVVSMLVFMVGMIDCSIQIGTGVYNRSLVMQAEISNFLLEEREIRGFHSTSTIILISTETFSGRAAAPIAVRE